MDHDDHDSHSHSSMMTMGGDGDDPFCEGSGRVMLSGFQAASGAGATCVLFLFEGAVIDTGAKYAITAIGIFLMGFANEMLRYTRDLMVKGAFPGLSGCNSFTVDLVRTLAFAVQMLLAYFLMLLTMLYEYVFLIMIILGLSVGHMVTLRLAAARRTGEKQQPDVSAPGSSGTPCCNNSTDTA